MITDYTLFSSQMPPPGTKFKAVWCDESGDFGDIFECDQQGRFFILYENEEPYELEDPEDWFFAVGLIGWVKA